MSSNDKCNTCGDVITFCKCYEDFIEDPKPATIEDWTDTITNLTKEDSTNEISYNLNRINDIIHSLESSKTNDDKKDLDKWERLRSYLLELL